MKIQSSYSERVQPIFSLLRSPARRDLCPKGIARDGLIQQCRIIMTVSLVVSVLFILLRPTAVLAEADRWRTVVNQIEQEVLQARQDTKATEAIIENEKKGLLSSLDSLKKKVSASQKDVEKLRANFEKLREKEEKMRTELSTQEEEIHNLEGTVQGAARDADKFIRNSLITPEYPACTKRIGLLTNQGRFPGLEDIRSLVDIFFEHIKGSGEIRKRTGKFISEKGDEVEGEILRIGDFMALYRFDGSIGCLQYDEKSGHLISIPAKLTWLTRRAFRKYFDGKSDHLPLDLSGGAVFRQLTHRRTVMDWLESGGLLVWPILLIGLVALVLVVERLFFLGHLNGDTDEIMARVDTMITKGLWDDCRAFCSAHSRIPTCKVLRAGLEHIEMSREVIENVLQESILREIPRVERFLPTLSVLAAIAPLLGLLGTVTGIINTFQVITQFGTSDPRMMSGGISEALITTQIGLAVAIPILLMHHFLERRVDKVIADMEEKGTALMVTLSKNGMKHGKVGYHVD